VDGSITQGGYADYHRSFGRFAVPIPEGLSDEVAAPMLCG
jgi:alcohol dehydrogenase (NADP+)